MKIRTWLTLVALSTSANSYAWTSWVGVLEDWPVSESVDKNSKADPKYEARVRPLFIKIDQNKWLPAPRPGEENPPAVLPKAFSWDVCFSGRSEGQLTSMLIADGIPTTTPPYILRAEDRAPWRTRRSNDYAGWMPAPVYKPILLMSSLNASCKDPEKWKQAGQEKAKAKLPAMSAMLRQSFANATSGVSPYEFADKDLRLFKSWGSAKHGYYAAIKTKLKEHTTELFHLAATGDLTYLGRDMMLVDAGDFDGDGATEILFKRRAEKRDVYELYIRGEKVSESVWDYP